MKKSSKFSFVETFTPFAAAAQKKRKKGILYRKKEKKRNKFDLK